MRTTVSKRLTCNHFHYQKFSEILVNFLSLTHRCGILSARGYTSSMLNLRKPCCSRTEREIHFGARRFSLSWIQTVIYHTAEFHVNIERVFAADCATHGLALSYTHPSNRNVWLDSCFLMHFLSFFTGVPTLYNLSNWQLVSVTRLICVEQCFSTAGPRPGTGPWRDYTGPREVLLEFVILVV